MKKKLAFLLGITPNLAFAAGNVALGINKYMSDKDYDIIIYYTELAQNDLEVFSKVPHVILRQFSLPEDFINTMMKKLPSQSRFRSKHRLMCFAHFEVFPLLKEYQNVAWLDADTAIQKDLSTIIDYAKPFGITRDTPWTVADQFTRRVEGYKMDIEGHCTAVMVVNDSLPYMQIYKWLYEQAVEYADCIKNPDQAIISLMLQKFGISPVCMELEEWQCIAWKDEAPNARIVHFGTERKVWNDPNICNAFPEWYRTHLQWLEKGGSDFNRNQVDFHNILGTLDNASRAPQKNQKIISMFGVPVLKIKEEDKETKSYLFGFIPFVKTKIKE